MSIVVSTGCDTDDKTFNSRKDAEQGKATHLDFCDECDSDDVEIYNANDPDTDTQPVAETVHEGVEEVVTDDKPHDALSSLGESLDTDPLDILPGHMIDDIQGQPAVNKRGYAMIAERYGIEVSADVVQFPWDNDDGRAVARATAITEDGKEYSGWASASKSDGDMEEQLIELAETRALKRAVSWASGVGIVSYQEMMGELEGTQ